MPSSRIGIINPNSTEKVTIEVPNDVAIRDLIPAIVEAMDLPNRGQNGARLRYHLSVDGASGNSERLDEDDTLQGNTIENDASLQLTVEMVAGIPEQV